MKAKNFFILLIFVILWQQIPAQSQEATFKPKSESKALTWSLLSTLTPATVGLILVVTDEKVEEQAVAGSAVFSLGIIMGPSIGYFYGGCSGRGLAGVGIRSGLIVGFVLLAAATAEQGDIGGGEASAIVASSGVALATIAAIYDIARVKSSVRKKNQSRPGATLMVTPKYFAKSGVGGVEIRMKF